MSLASSLLASLAGKDYTKFRKSHGCYTLVLLAKASPLPFIATKRLAKEEPVNQQCTFTNAFMAAFTDAVKAAIMQILQTVTSHLSTE